MSENDNCEKSFNHSEFFCESSRHADALKFMNEIKFPFHRRHPTRLQQTSIKRLARQMEDVEMHDVLKIESLISLL